MKNQSPIELSKKWIEQFVIALNLCPFAGVPFRKDQIRYVLEQAEEEEYWVKTILAELAYLCKVPSSETETTLIIYQNVLKDFLEYNDFVGMAESFLDELNLSGVIQIASFHPDYRFAGVSANDPANFTNRSPYPMLHLLREKSISEAVEHYPNPESIPERNIQRLREMGTAKIEALYQKISKN
jgi:hypothetical protein